MVGEMYPGDVLQLRVQRNATTFELPAKLGRFSEFDEALAEFDDFIGGQLSQRRTGFRRVVQHDTALLPSNCGGPVIDVQGRFVGINIARAARTTSYLLPADEIQSVLRQLQTTRTDKLQTIDVGSAP